MVHQVPEDVKESAASTLEFIGTAAVVAVAVGVTVVFVAPRLVSAMTGGAFAALGARLLKGSFEGR